MKFKELAEFIDSGMRMSHIYQPVMLVELLENGGRLKDSEIAKALLARDESQIGYYTTITNNMVGTVLRNRGVVERNRKTREFSLIDYESLSIKDVAILKEKCLKRLEEYLDKIGRKIFNHRRMSVGYISGTLRYEVLKRAKFHCELCGISAEEKALAVDHILPRNKGGSDDLCNLQALCYSCKAMKRDRDDTDFRSIRESYMRRDKACLFCSIPKDRIVAENELAYVINDGFAVTAGHCLIIPKRHIANYFALGQAEINACSHLLDKQKEKILKEDSSVSGFNVGVNVGESAGQTIFHCHIHLIPRRLGDVSDPVGGVRNVIPGKGNYKTPNKPDAGDGL